MLLGCNSFIVHSTPNYSLRFKYLVLHCYTYKASKATFTTIFELFVVKQKGFFLLWYYKAIANFSVCSATKVVLNLAGFKAPKENVSF